MNYEINVGGDNAALDGEGGGNPNSESRSALSTPVNNLRLKVKDTPYDNAELNSALEEIETKGTKKELPAYIGVANAVALSVDKFQSGDERQAISGVLDIVSAATLLVQPYGAIISPLFKLLSGVFMWHKKIAEEKGAEPLESILKRVITEALQLQTSDDLRASADGEMVLMIQDVTLLQKWIVEPVDRLKESGVHTALLAGTYDTDGIVFSAKLNFYIKQSWKNRGNKKDTRFIGKHLYCYAQVYMIRQQLLFFLTSLYAALEDEVMVESTQLLQAKHKQTAIDAHGHFTSLASPEFATDNHVYDLIHELDSSDRIIVEAYLASIGIRMEGFVCTVDTGFQSINTDSQNDIKSVHLFVPHSEQDHERVGAQTDKSSPDIAPDLKHRLFRKIPLNSTTTLNGEKFETFKLYALQYGGYVKLGDDVKTETNYFQHYKWVEGESFFVEARTKTYYDENFTWFLDKKGRLTSTWGNRPMFYVSIEWWKKIQDRPYIMVAGTNENVRNSKEGSTIDFEFNKQY
jgi:hypothetical protein